LSTKHLNLDRPQGSVHIPACEYNRNVKTGVWTAAALLACVSIISCGNKMQTREAVERGVRTYLSQRSGLNMKAMDVTVTSVKFHDNKADAQVSFTLKGGNLSSGLVMGYTLEPKNGEWSVMGHSQSDMSQHTGGAAPGAPNANPHGGAPVPGMQPGVPLPQSALPNGQLPPGHPPLTSGSK
jgi:hypothetical protein